MAHLNVVQFSVDDTSPTISYSPFGDTFSTPDLSAGWNPYFNESGFATAQGAIGNGTSRHITSMNGASLTIKWHGTGIQLLGNATLASYTITVDGVTQSSTTPSNDVLADIRDLSYAPHNISLTAQIPSTQNAPNSSMVMFEKAVLFTSNISLTSNSTSPSHALDDDNIAFLGQWSYESSSSGLAAFHSSGRTGDKAKTSFNGTTLLIQGMTSPLSGNYSVTIDNVTSAFSGRSSFTAYNSLLYYASGLDENTEHSVEIQNTGGGNLALLVNGFTAFTPPIAESPSPPSMPTSSAGMTFSGAAIVAFLLAGILGFLLISGVLFYFFVHRPAKRRRQAWKERLRQHHKEQEAGIVIDISQAANEDHELASPSHDRRSVRSGFGRWRRQGSSSGMSIPLPLHLSDLGDDKKRNLDDVMSEEYQLPRTPESDSSTRRKRDQSKGKARQLAGMSLPSSLRLGFPMRRTRRRASEQSTEVASLDYVSTFAAAERSPHDNAEPPSYAASVSLKESSSNSQLHPSHISSLPLAPRSVTRSPTSPSYPREHSRQLSGGLLLREAEPNTGYDSPTPEYEHSQSHSSAAEVIPMRTLSREDFGSVQREGSDNGSALIGPSALQHVIRSLSPRTVACEPAQTHRRLETFASSDFEAREHESRELIPPVSPVSPISPISPVSRESFHIRPLPRPLITEEETVEVKDGIFLGVGRGGPLHIRSDSRSLGIPKSTSSADRIYFTADPQPSGRTSRASHVMVEVPAKEVPGARQEAMDQPEFVEGPSRQPFRLTLQTVPTNLPIRPDTGDPEASFLDFGSTYEASIRTRSIQTKPSQEGHWEALRLPLPIHSKEPKSRWSNTTAPSLSTTNRGGSSSGGSSQKPSSSAGSNTFPIPVTLDIPPSPYHVMDTSRASRISGMSQNIEYLHVHPQLGDAIDSPTGSIPMSVSDIHFRNSVSDADPLSRPTTAGSLAFRVSTSTAHTPFLGTIEEVNRHPFDPSLLVSRVLGLPPPRSSLGTCPESGSEAGPAGPSRTCSPANPSPSPHHDSSTTNDNDCPLSG